MNRTGLALIILLLVGFAILLMKSQQTGRAQTPTLQIAVEPPVGAADTAFIVAVKNFSWERMARVEVSASEHFDQVDAGMIAEEPAFVGQRRRANIPFSAEAFGLWELQVDAQWLDGGTATAQTVVPVGTAGSTTGIVQIGDEVEGVVRAQGEDGAIGFWLFEAAAGQEAMFAVDWESRGNETRYLIILDEEGENLVFDVDLIADFTFSDAGAYLVAVVYQGERNAVSYTLSVSEALSEDEGGGELALDSSAIGLIEPRNDEDIWRFDAEVGDVIAVGLRAPASSSLDPELVLQDANGVVVAANDNYGGSEPALTGIFQEQDAGLEYVIPATGTYQIVARSDNAASAGPYRLLLQRATVPPPASVLVPDRTAEEDKPAGASQAWQLEGEAGDEIVLQVVAQEQGFDPVITLYGPDGSEVGSDDDSGGDLNPRLEVTLPVNSIYTVVVSSYDGSGGRYSIEYSRGD